MNRFTRRLTRRDLLRTGGMALGLSLLAACAPAAPQPKESETVVDAAEPVVETQPPAVVAAEELPAATATTARPADRPFSPSDPNAFVLAAGRPQLVEFYATWWLICQRMRPIVHGLEDRYSGQIDFVYLDLDDPDVEPHKATLRYRNRPHFALLDADGNIVESWVGSVDEEVFVAAFEKLLQ